MFGCKTQGIDDPEDKTAPAEVNNLTATAGNGQATLNWLPPGDSDYAGVKITAAGISEIAVAKDTISKIITGLTNGTEYTFTVQTVDTTGNVSKGITVKATPSAPIIPPSDTTPPAEVASLTATAGNGIVTLNWVDPSDVDFTNVEISLNGVVSSNVVKGTQTKVISSLVNDTEYTFTVKTIDTSSNMSAGKTIKATPSVATDTTPPSNVTSLTAAAGDGQVVLTWNEPSESDFAKVSISGTGFTTVEVSKGITSQTITGLANSTLYTFTVKSIDTNGNISSGVSKDATPVAGIPTTYTVTFHSNGGSTVSTITGVTTGSKITQPGNPTQTGYTFVAWYKEFGLTSTWDFGTDTVTSNTDLYAKWTVNTYAVTFVYDNGSSNTEQSTNYNTTLLSLPSPTKTGYTFDGWWTVSGGTGDKFTTSSKVTGNITVYAKWIADQYVVTFDSQSATTEANPTTKTVTVPSTTVGSLPTAPTKTGYTFGGWWTETNGGGTEFIASTTVSGNITVHAKWIAKSSNADLHSLSLTGATLNETFSAGTTSYTSNIANSVSSITINATVEDTGKASLIGTGTVSPSVGANTFNVVVTAENGTTKTYTIVVTRAIAATSGNIYYTAGNNNIYKKPTSGGESYVTAVNVPVSISADASDNLYYIISGNDSKVYKIASGGGETQIALTNDPIAISVDASGNIYYITSGSNNIYKKPTSGGEITATTVTINPLSISVDASGNIYYTAGNNNIYKKPTSGGESYVTAVNVPVSISVDTSDNLYYIISSIYDSRVYKIASGGGETQIALANDPTAISIR
ncbi:MAG: InlB B-repeat-containing protein [Patescibacteria group bacterium]